MQHIHSAKFRQLIVLTFGLLIIGLAVFAIAQNKKAPKKEEIQVNLKDAVVRESKNTVRLTDASKFEFVKQGKEVVVIVKETRRKTLGTMMCGVCPGGQCLTVIEGPKFRCVGCGGNGADCTLNTPF